MKCNSLEEPITVYYRLPLPKGLQDMIKHSWNDTDIIADYRKRCAPSKCSVHIHRCLTIILCMHIKKYIIIYWYTEMLTCFVVTSRVPPP